jgi:hypothetical protein
MAYALDISNGQQVCWIIPTIRNRPSPTLTMTDRRASPTQAAGIGRSARDRFWSSRKYPTMMPKSGFEIFPTNVLASLDMSNVYASAMIITDAELIAQIDNFIERTGIAPSRFGLDAMGDGALLSGLRAGRSLSLRNAEKVLRFMAEYVDPAAAESEAA